MERKSSIIRIEGVLSLQEENLYHFKCINNHDNLVEIQAFKFELLFESGLRAIKDNYLLESVLSLTASLERFYEFFIRIKMNSNGLISKDFDQLFNNIANQSERQYGAFLFIYGYTYKQNPPVLIKKKSVEFRNKVVHKGYLPKEIEVLTYAEDVFNTIKFYYSKLLTDNNKEIFNYLTEIQSQRQIENRDLMDKTNTNISSIAPCLAISHILHIDEFNKVDLMEYYESIRKSEFYI